MKKKFVSLVDKFAFFGCTKENREISDFMLENELVKDILHGMMRITFIVNGKFKRLPIIAQSAKMRNNKIE